MKIHIEQIRKTREYVMSLVKELSLEKLNIIPHGFNNNILWNMGHLVAAQQNICYLRGGLNPAIPEQKFANFKSGSRPEHFYQSDEEDAVKEMLFSSLDSLVRDYQNNVFDTIVPFNTRYDVRINNIDDAIALLHFHEGLHTGIVFSIRRLVMK
jgi:hypothetical protein